MMKTSLDFGDLDLIFKVTAELNSSNFSICVDGGGDQLSLKTIQVINCFVFICYFRMELISRRIILT